MKKIFIFLISILPLTLSGQSLEQDLFNAYDAYKEESIQNRRFKHKDIIPLIQTMERSDICSVRQVGHSIEGRSINLISMGHGNTQVLLWSQMHGDESTATMALMDLFNFFRASDDFDGIKKLILDSLTLHFIPMLNPDGAERFQRRNALEIDLNRDALRLQCPESRILKKVRDSLKADWGFNLHDQNRYYAAGISDKTASFSFLAPAFNYEKDINETRGNAMQLIGVLNEVLNQFIPGKIGKYSDDFEPRAFGDNIQKWGTRTILIEVGGLESDREKQYLRKLHFVLLCKAFEAIASGSHLQVDLTSYDSIPFNDSNAFNELLIRNARYQAFNQDFMIDIAFRHYENHKNEQANEYYFSSGIQDIGDLSILHGYYELDASGYEIKFGKVHPDMVNRKADLHPDQILKNLRKGYTIYRTSLDFPKADTDDIPIQLVRKYKATDQEIKQGKNPSLLLIKDGEIKKVIINGFLFDLEEDSTLIKNKIHSLIP